MNNITKNYQPVKWRR